MRHTQQTGVWTTKLLFLLTQALIYYGKTGNKRVNIPDHLFSLDSTQTIWIYLIITGKFNNCINQLDMLKNLSDGSVITGSTFHHTTSLFYPSTDNLFHTLSKQNHEDKSNKMIIIYLTIPSHTKYRFLLWGFFVQNSNYDTQIQEFTCITIPSSFSFSCGVFLVSDLSPLPSPFPCPFPSLSSSFSSSFCSFLLLR